ncbi:hypothetical protein CYMTET_53668 [Cymbomonas tetramitiformis]|uniref:Uncharacterized protein n=1 Tax=Cymbomonas tetramitiformis TaxID=36881 RepID=A0AAE0BHN6_9CHLO|nr:hypothetical protein CYMTET_53668 [Cymbomonas tetramitiformis]
MTLLRLLFATVLLCSEASGVAAWLAADELESVHQQLRSVLPGTPENRPVRRSSHGRGETLSQNNTKTSKQDCSSTLKGSRLHKALSNITRAKATTSSWESSCLPPSTECDDDSSKKLHTSELPGQVFEHNFTHFARSGKKLHFAYQANVSDAVHSLDFEHVMTGLKSVHCHFNSDHNKGYNVLRIHLNLTAASLATLSYQRDSSDSFNNNDVHYYQRDSDSGASQHSLSGLPLLSYIRAGTILIASAANSAQWGCSKTVSSTDSEFAGRDSNTAREANSTKSLREMIIGCALPGYEMSSAISPQYSKTRSGDASFSGSMVSDNETSSLVSEGCYMSAVETATKSQSASSVQAKKTTEGDIVGNGLQSEYSSDNNVVTVVVLTKTVGLKDVFHNVQVRYFLGDAEKDVDSAVRDLYEQKRKSNMTDNIDTTETVYRENLTTNRSSTTKIEVDMAPPATGVSSIATSAVTGALATGGRVGHNTRPFVRTATPAVRLVMEAAAVTAAPVILEIIFMMAGRAISAMIVHAILIVVRASTVTSPLPALTHAVRVTQAVIGVMEVVITIAPSVSQEIICTMAGRAISALSVRINGRMAGIARQESTATTKMRFQMRILSMIVTRVTQAVIDVMEAALAIAPSVNQEIICTTA